MLILHTLPVSEATYVTAGAAAEQTDGGAILQTDDADSTQTLVGALPRHLLLYIDTSILIATITIIITIINVAHCDWYVLDSYRRGARKLR